jgi:hypothetical protein
MGRHKANSHGATDAIVRLAFETVRKTSKTKPRALGAAVLKEVLKIVKTRRNPAKITCVRTVTKSLRRQNIVWVKRRLPNTPASGPRSAFFALQY